MASQLYADITEIRQASNGLAAKGFVPGVAGFGLLAGVGLVAAAIGSSESYSALWQQFCHAYLLAVMYVTSLGVGGLFFVLGHHITGGRWGTPVRRLAEITAGTLSVSFVMFLPVLAMVLTGDSSIYPWVNPEMFVGDKIMQSKAPFLDPMWFAIRSVVYYGLWIWMARTMLGMSVRQDSSEPLKRAKKMQWLAGPMVLLYALSMNFASFDWMMSLEPHWFSTMFGVYFFAGSFGAFLAAVLLLVIKLQPHGVLTQSVTVEQRHDIAKLMFAFVVFWGYIAFSQYMLIWYAAIPEETLWYDIRQQGAWPFWGLLLVFGHLLIPFLGFMSSAVRRSPTLMKFWCVWMLVIHWCDLAYLVLPQVREEGSLAVTLMLAAATTLGALGVFAWAWMSGAAGKWLLPVQDPRLPISLSYHNH